MRAQLADYTTATMQQADPTKTALFARVRETWTIRSSRDDPLAVEAVLPEAVLRQLVGSSRVLKAQLLHLMEVSELPEVSLRIVPYSAAAYPAVNISFSWLSFPHRQHNDVVYVETFLGSEYLEAHDEVQRVSERFFALRRLALSEGESLELIAEAVARF